MNIYFISGLGADHRAFQNIRLPAHFSARHIQWIEPEKDESITSYAKNLSAQVDTSTPFALVGLSFGGILATEMSRMIQPSQTIILSSIGTSHEFPMKYKIVSWLKLHRLVPVALYKKPTSLTNWFFGIRSKKDASLLASIFADTSPRFLKWAIDRLLHWKNEERLPGLYHIHGDKDRLLPVKKLKADVVIPGAGHLMVYTHGREVSRLISEKLAEIKT